MAENAYDVVVIGSGPGGYVAAIRCAQLGMKTAIVERYSTLGGTCLNVGCIPSKALLDSSEHFHNAEKNFAEHGIKIDAPVVDMPQMIKRKAEVVKQTCDGVEFLMKKNKIDVVHGHGTFTSGSELEVKDGKKSTKVTGKTKRKFRPNIQKVTAVMPDGSIRKVKASTKAIKMGLVVKPLKRKYAYKPEAEASE